MSESAGFAIRLPDTVGHADSPATNFDLSVAHSFWFGRRLWLNAAGLCVQAALLLAAGETGLPDLNRLRRGEAAPRPALPAEPTRAGGEGQAMAPQGSSVVVEQRELPGR